MVILSNLPRFLCALVATAATADCADRNSLAIQSLVQTERNFAQAAADSGIRASFLHYFADVCVVFTSEPTDGKKLYRAYRDKGERLNWEPIFATISRDGDLGCTTGPWTFKKSASDEQPSDFGEFVSIWKVQPNKEWKVVLDLGIDHSGPARNNSALDLLRPELASPPPRTDSRENLKAAQAALHHALQSGNSDAIMAAAHEKMRLLRSDSEPAIGKAAAKNFLESNLAKVTRRTIAGEMSRSGDFAYEYGSYSAASEPAELGHFLSVWALDRTGSWKLVLDVQRKRPRRESG
jgi:ketosteroid isomerase-like protein